MTAPRSLLSIGTLAILLGTALAGTALGESEAPPAEDCSTLRRSIDERIQAFHQEQQPKRDAFYAEQHEASSAFGAEAHTEDEWRAFQAEQDDKRQSFEDGMRTEHEAYAKAKWDAYNSQCGYQTSASPQHADGTYPADGQADGCRSKADAIQAIMADIGPRMKEAHEAFREKSMALAQEFAASEHTGEEIRAFRDAESARFQAFQAGEETDLKAAFEGQGLLDCFKLMQGQMEGPRFRDDAKPAYSDAQPMPAGGGKMDGKAMEIMRECMAKVEDFMRAHRAERQYPMDAEPRPAYGDEPRPAYHDSQATYGDDPQPAYSDGQTTRADYEGYPSSPPPYEARPAESPQPYTDDGMHRGMPPEMPPEAREIMMECENRVRALYQEQHDEDGFGSFQFYWDEETGEIQVKGKCLSMIGLPDEQMMTAIDVCGVRWIDALYGLGFLAEFSPEQTDRGSAIKVRDANGELVLAVHDNPNGIIHLRATEESGALVLDLVDTITLVKTGEGYRCSDDGARCAILLHGAEATLGEGNVLTLASGKATFVVGVEHADGNELAKSVDDAVLQKKIGGKVKIAKQGAAATPIGDLEIETEETESAEGADASPVFKATLESQTGDPTTVTFDFADGYFAGDELDVLIEGLNEDGTTSALTVSQASSLADVLDAADDDADAEWWIVQDEDGYHVIVSFSHWSAKQVTIQSGETATGGLPVPGFGAALLVGALGLVLVGVGVRRRRE